MTSSVYFLPRDTLVHSAVLRLHVIRLSVRLSVCDVGGSGSMENGAWAYPGTAQIFWVPPIISGTDKATNFKFGRCIHRVHPNKSPFKILGENGAWAYPGMPKFFEYHLLSQEWVKLQTSNTHILSIERNKSPLQISGKVAGGVCEDSRIFSGHPYIGRIARSSLR